MKKEVDETTIKDIRILFRLKKENEANKGRIIRNIKSLSEHRKEDYYKPVKVGNFRINNYIEYESNDGRNQTLSVEEYLNKIRSYFKRHHK